MKHGVWQFNYTDKEADFQYLVIWGSTDVGLRLCGGCLCREYNPSSWFGSYENYGHVHRALRVRVGFKIGQFPSHRLMIQCFFHVQNSAFKCAQCLKVVESSMWYEKCIFFCLTLHLLERKYKLQTFICIPPSFGGYWNMDSKNNKDAQKNYRMVAPVMLF